MPVDEAMEDHDAAYEDEAKVSSEGEGDDLEENMDEDYRANQQLDRYEGRGLDERAQRNMTFEERQAAERAL